MTDFGLTPAQVNKPDLSGRLAPYDMDDVLVDFPNGIAKTAPDLILQFEGHIDDIPRIFGRTGLLESALHAIDELSDLFDTYILSTAPWDNPSAWSDKLLWVKRHLGTPAYKRLTLSHHKNLNNRHFSINDRIKNGADQFRGERIHLARQLFRTGRRRCLT